jgi:hypothetical protein
VHVLDRFWGALPPGGVILDLQVVPPDPVVECDGERVCEIEGRALLDNAAVAAAAVDDAVARGLLVEEAVDDHGVRAHYPTGAALVEDFATKRRNVPDSAVPALRALEGPCVVVEPCRVRRLVVPRAAG